MPKMTYEYTCCCGTSEITAHVLNPDLVKEEARRCLEWSKELMRRYNLNPHEYEHAQAIFDDSNGHHLWVDREGDGLNENSKWQLCQLLLLEGDDWLLDILWSKDGEIKLVLHDFDLIPENFMVKNIDEALEKAEQIMSERLNKDTR
jgi:hypothetical protein